MVWAREFPDCFLWLFQNTIISVEELESGSDFFLVPNPANNQICLQSLTTAEKVQIDIFDVSGKSWVSLHQPISKPINVQSLRNGTYILKVDNGQKSAAKIFEIQH